MKNIFIVNPTSGKGNALSYVPYIEEYFLKNGGEYQIIKTEYVGNATEIAKRYKEEDNVVLYSVGGDGTMKEVLDGIQPNVPLCVIPGGTGNDFYKTIDIRKLEIKQLIKECIEGEIVDCDYGVLNGTSKFLNICSFGLDADINVYACDYVKVETKIPNNLVYAYSAFKVGLHPTSVAAEIEVDDQKINTDIILLAIANGKYYGGGFKADPYANISDGKLGVCCFKAPVKVLRLIHLILLYMKGKHTKEKECIMASGENIKIKFAKEVNYQIDGENHKLKEANITIHKQAIKVKMPKSRIGG